MPVPTLGALQPLDVPNTTKIRQALQLPLQPRRGSGETTLLDLTTLGNLQYIKSAVMWQLILPNNATRPLPSFMTPASETFFPQINAEPNAVPGTAALYFTGDAKRGAGFITLTGGQALETDAVLNVAVLEKLDMDLRAALSVQLVTTKYTLTYPLDVGFSHVANDTPSRLNIAFEVRLAISNRVGTIVVL